MIETLTKIVSKLNFDDVDKDSFSSWDSLVINKRKPHTFRMMKQIGKYRLCLHKFEPCSDEECFIHPHSWPASFLVLAGSYIQTFSTSNTLSSPPHPVSREIVGPGHTYEITTPFTWHKIQPLETTYTIMLNGPPFTHYHTKCRFTKGKDLDKMSHVEKNSMMGQFNYLVLTWKHLLGL